MPGTQHRKLKRNIGRQPKRVALVGAAAITVAALTAGLVPPPTEQMLHRDVKLAAAVEVFPEPDEIPDLTGGLGTAGYDLSQAIAEAIQDPRVRHRLEQPRNTVRPDQDTRRNLGQSNP
jgi:hypothetical protein